MKALVVINPKSGGGKGLTIGGKVRRHFAKSSDEITFVEGASKDESLLQVDALCTQIAFDCLICVGGDGFIHDLLPALIKHQLPLLVVPAGTGNDFARTLGLFGAKFDLLLNLPTITSPSEINIGMVQHGSQRSPFVQILSTGFDSVVNQRANDFKRIRGTIKYVVAVLLEVWRFRPINFDIAIDGHSQKQKAMLVCVANGKSYGGGMKIVPQAKNDDDLLNIMIVDRVNPFRLLMVFPRVFFGTHVKHPKVHFFTGKEIEISGETEAFADGERISSLPVQISLSDQKLKVFTL